MILSCIGVIFGVALFIVAQAATAGFERYYIDTTLGTSSSIQITDRFQSPYTMIVGEEKKKGEPEERMVAVENQKRRKFYPGIPDAYRVMRVLKEFSQVVACAPVVEERAFLRSSFQNEVVVVQGIDLELQLQTTDLAKQIIRGKLEDFRNDGSSICLSGLIADKMQLQVGQYVTVVGNAGDNRRFRVTTVYQSGINAVDEKRVYVHRKAAQNVLRLPNFTSTILVKLKNPERADEISKAFEGLLSHRSRPWQDREKGMLQVLATLRIFGAVAVSAIILLAGFGIFNILTMSVLEKTKEIAILRSMGYTRFDISSIFLWQGVGIAILGITSGSIIGAGLTALISSYPIKIRGPMAADHYVVSWDITHYVMAAGVALVAIFIASYFPSRRAAHLQPVNILRGSSQ